MRVRGHRGWLVQDSSNVIVERIPFGGLSRTQQAGNVVVQAGELLIDLGLDRSPDRVKVGLPVP